MKKWLAFFTVCTLSLVLISPHHTYAAVNPQDLDQYIQEIGLSKQELLNYLSDYNLTLNDFPSINDLKDYLGQPLNAQTLPTVLNDYGLTKDGLNQILKANGMSLTDYSFVDELESDLALFTMKQELTSFMKSLGLTDNELANLSHHLAQVDLTKIKPQLETLSEQMSSMTFDSASELSASDQEILNNTFDQMMQLFQLKSKFYLKKDNQTQLISLSNLFNVGNINNADLIIDLYDLNGNKLANLSINTANFNSDVITKIMNYLKTLLSRPTIEGGQLPNTATHTWNFLILGLLLLTFGAGLLKRSRKNA